MNKVRLISIAMILLMVSLPITYAQTFSADLDIDTEATEQQRGEQKFPEDIILQIDNYEPTVLVSSLIEENDVPIYANLKGTPSNPFITVPKIRKVFVANADLGPYVRRVSWIPPQTRGSLSPVTSIRRGAAGPPSVTKYATLEDLGYLEIILKRIEKEKDVPDGININLNTRILYDLSQGIGTSEQDLVLIPISEQEWLANKFEQEKSSFWSERGELRNGFFRVDEIMDDGRARIVSYGPNIQGEVKPITTFVMGSGETSDVRTLTSPSESFENKFRVKVNSITDSGDKANLRLNIAGRIVDKKVSKGELLYELSSWRVKDIGRRNNQDVVVIESIDPRNRQAKEITGGRIKQEEKSTQNPNEKPTQPDPKELLFKNADQLRFDGNIDAAISEYNRIATNSQVTVEGKSITPTSEDQKKAESFVNYLKAIKEFQSVIDNFNDLNFTSGPNVNLDDNPYGVGFIKDNGLNTPSQEVAAKAILRQAEVYEKIGDNHLAIQKYNEFLENHGGEEVYGANFQSEIGRRIKSLSGGSNYVSSTFSFLDNGDYVEVKLNGIEQGKGVSSVFFKIGNDPIREINVGEPLFDASSEFDWYVSKVTNRAVTIQRRTCKSDGASCTETFSASSNSKNIAYANDPDDPNKKIKIMKLVNMINIIDRREVHLTVLPGDPTGISESKISLHIPIEKRAIKFSDDKVNDLINQTNKLIEDLNRIIEPLQKIVETWKLICLGTFAFLTVKGFFQGTIGGRSIARTEAINDRWRDECNRQVADGKHKSFDNCLIANKNAVEADIDTYSNAITKTNDAMENAAGDKYKAMPKDDTLKVGELEGYENKEDVSLVEMKTVRDMNLYKNIAEDPNAPLETKQEAQKKYNEAKEKLNQQNNVYSNVNSRLSNWEGNNPRDQWKDPDIDYLTAKTLAKQAFITEANLKTHQDPSLQDKKIQEVSSVSNFNNNYVYFDKEGNQHRIQPHKNQDGKVTVDNKGRTVYVKPGDVNKPLDQILDNELYVSDSEFTLGGERLDYVNPQVYYNSKCKAADAVPTGDGNYVSVDYDQYCRPIKKSLWNVGSDGKMLTSDDKQIHSFSTWDQNARDVRIQNADRTLGGVNDQLQKGRSATVNVGGRVNRPVPVANSLVEANRKTSCTDFMDPSDCNLLFLACDSVICPTSRCNLGGAVEISNVPRSGLIGSITLCIPTAKTVCLTGILAGLQNIRSILQGFNQCLNTQRVQGKSVGICDKIRSVYICDLVWREVVTTLRIKSGVLGLAQSRIGGEGTSGGGEYLTFQDSFQNSVGGIQYFVNDYGRTAFGAFKGQSVDELGFTICEAAIFGKLPDLEGFIDQIKEPESPPQFFAEFDTFVHSERTRQNRYQVVYHVYAGENKAIRYSVFLRDKNDPTLPPYGVTERCNGRVSNINKGGFASYTVDCVAPMGYSEVCVQIDGRVAECGFGKVTTSYAVNALTDYSIDKQIRQQINTETQCISGSEGIGRDPENIEASFGSATYNSIGLYRNGLRRICNIENPGIGSNTQQHWSIVGSCGKDEVGRSLGSCWVDERSIEIRNKELKQEVDTFLEKSTETGLVESGQKLNDEVVNTIFSSQADKHYNEALLLLNYKQIPLSIDVSQAPELAKEELKKAIGSYKNIVDSTINLEYAALAKYKIGMSYYLLGKLTDITQIVPEEGKKDPIALPGFCSPEEHQVSIYNPITDTSDFVNVNVGQLAIKQSLIVPTVYNTKQYECRFECQEDGTWKFLGDDEGRPYCVESGSFTTNQPNQQIQQNQEINYPPNGDITRCELRDRGASWYASIQHLAANNDLWQKIKSGEKIYLAVRGNGCVNLPVEFKIFDQKTGQVIKTLPATFVESTRNYGGSINGDSVAFTDWTIEYFKDFQYTFEVIVNKGEKKTRSVRLLNVIKGDDSISNNQECILREAHWYKDKTLDIFAANSGAIKQGTTVYLAVKGEGSCKGKEVEFTIFEKDGDSKPDWEFITVAGTGEFDKVKEGFAAVAWRTIYVVDSPFGKWGGNPEYIFEAKFLEGGISRISMEELEVKV